MSNLVKFVKTTSARLSQVPVQDGQIIVLTDKGQLYYDADGTRYSSGVGSSDSGDDSSSSMLSPEDRAKLDGIAEGADNVSFTRTLNSGTEVGKLVINGTSITMYAPTNTDTHYTTGLKVGASSTATANAAANNGSVHMNVLDNTTVRDSHKISGSGSVSVTSDSSGNITITGTDNDTKNTAGSTDSSSKLFLVGAPSQGANPQTYSQDTAYIGTDGHLYSDSKQVVNLSGSQALTNKTYNGYTLGAACAKGVDTTPTANSSNLITSGAVHELKKSVVDGKQLLADTINEFSEPDGADDMMTSDNTFAELNSGMLNALQCEYQRGAQSQTAASGTATAAQVLQGYTFSSSSGVGLSGTMVNRGAVVQSLSCGQVCLIPEGYHNGSGKVTANSLASQTAVDNAATARMLLKGRQAWVNGTKITGTMTDYSNSVQTVSTTYDSVDSITVDIPDGFHSTIRINQAPAYEKGYCDACSDIADKMCEALWDYGYDTSGDYFDEEPRDGSADYYEIAYSITEEAYDRGYYSGTLNGRKVSGTFGASDYWDHYASGALNVQFSLPTAAGSVKIGKYISITGIISLDGCNAVPIMLQGTYGTRRCEMYYSYIADMNEVVVLYVDLAPDFSQLDIHMKGVNTNTLTGESIDYQDVYIEGRYITCDFFNVAGSYNGMSSEMYE